MHEGPAHRDRCQQEGLAVTQVSHAGTLRVPSNLELSPQCKELLRKILVVTHAAVLSSPR
jgi:hypothetical protein